MINDRMISLAVKAAHQSKSDLFRHGAILYDKDRVLGIGWNVLEQTNTASFFNKYGCFHAEILALFRYLGGRIRKGNNKVYLFVVRINKRGEFRLSKPCKECEQQLHRNRIIVYYSTNEGIEKYIP